MILHKITLSILLLFTLSTLHAQHATLSTLKKEFADPTAAYRSAPLWVWHTTVTHAEIDRMLLELKDAGFGGAFVHPRPGLVTEYLSEDWFELFKYSVEVGKKLGLDIWIYDENSYPTGFAGGHVPAQMPESYNQGQGLTFEKSDRLPADLAQYPCILLKNGSEFRNITAEASKYKNTKGDYYLYKKSYYAKEAWHGGFSYVDLLYPGVTEKFIDVTMTGYEKALGSDLGPVVKGVFSDEPNIGSPGGIRWTPDLFDVFRTRWGYDLETSLPSLFAQTGDWKRTRHNYTSTLLQLFIDRWAKPMNAYCTEKGLAWTGHYWEHGWPDMGHGGDNMAMYAWHQMPAIDMLFNQFNDTHPQAQFGSARAVKELRSVANQTGAKRTLSETYGGGGWDVTFEDLKRLGDWEYVLGVNFMNQHLVDMTLEGSRKYDYPPTFTYHSPWWPHYRYLNDYFARLSLALSCGEQLNDLLVLEPTSTAWLYYSYAGFGPQLMQLGENFQQFVARLEKQQVEYDLGSENIIKDRASVTADGLKIGLRTYRRVVLPPLMENLDRPTFELLKEFVEQGGKLTAFSIPQYIDGSPSRELVDFIRFNKAVNYAPDADAKTLAALFPNDGCTFADIEGANDLYHHRRVYKDGELLFLTNSSLEKPVRGTVTLRGGSVLELDPFTAKIYEYPTTAMNGEVTLDFDLAPAASLLLTTSPEPSKGYKPRIATQKTELVTASAPLTVKAMRENALLLDFCDLEVNGDTYKGVHIADAAFKYFNHAGFPGGDPWTVAVQYKQQIAQRDTLTSGSATVCYTFEVAPGVDPAGMKLVTERPGLWAVSVNGQKVTANPGEWWLDKHFGVYSIAPAVKTGPNVVEMHVAPLSIYAEIEPVYIVGDFGVIPTSSGWAIEAPAALTTGSWKDQKMPFYSWEVAYTKQYKISDPKKGYAVRLPALDGTVAQVLVNGKDAGLIAFKPYELDITGLLKRGDNTVQVLITGSLRNLLGPHHMGAVEGISGPWHWKNIHGPAAGANYELHNYGLTEDFELRATK